MERFNNFYIEHKYKFLAVFVILFVLFLFLPVIFKNRVIRESEYTSKDEVALYMIEYHELPKNFITEMGYNNLSKEEKENNSFIIGGDNIWCQDRLKYFDIAADTMLKECDIYFDGYNTSNRGNERLIYTTNTKDVRVFYTHDNYKSIQEISYYRLQQARNSLWIVFAVYTFTSLSFLIFMSIYQSKKETEFFKNEINQA